MSLRGCDRWDLYGRRVRVQCPDGTNIHFQRLVGDGVVDGSFTLVAGDNLLKFGTTTILDEVNLQLVRGQRVALVGRNGEGSPACSRSLRDVWADAGTRLLRLKSSFLDQDVPANVEGTVHDVIRSGASRCLAPRRISESKRAFKSSLRIRHSPPRVQSAITLGGWELEARIDDLVARLSSNLMRSFVAGWRRRRAGWDARSPT